MKKLFLIMAVALGAATVSAQEIKWGASAGIGFSNISTDGDSPDSKLGFQIGALGEIAIAEGFYVVPELNFAQRGWQYERSGATSSTSLSYLQLPINALYKYGFSDNVKLLAFTGPYIGYGISGTAKQEYQGQSKEEDVKFGTDGYNALDFGWNIGVGAEYSKFFVKLQYNVGLTDIAEKSSMTNTNVGISVGYLF